MTGQKNPETRNVYAGIMTALLGFIVFLYPIASNMDGMNGGYAVMFIAIAFITPLGIITAAIYSIRAKTLRDIMSGKDLLVHWTYAPEDWKRYAEKEYSTEKSEKMALFHILTAWCILIGGGLYLVADDKDAVWFVFAVLFALVLFIRLLIAYTTRRSYKTNKKYIGEVYIGTKGVYINKSFHSWNFLSKLEDADIDTKNRLLELTYSALSNLGKNYETVRIPIPCGKENEAEAVVKTLTNRKKQKVLTGL